jgi:hypothetical protein
MFRLMEAASMSCKLVLQGLLPLGLGGRRFLGSEGGNVIDARIWDAEPELRMRAIPRFQSRKDQR